jgi:hypothetical protein
MPSSGTLCCLTLVGTDVSEERITLIIRVTRIGRAKDVNSSVLLYKFTENVLKVTAVIILSYHCYQLHTLLYRIFFSQG